MKRIVLYLSFVLLIIFGAGCEQSATLGDAPGESQQKISLSAENKTGLLIPNGFVISVFASSLGGPRVIAQDPGGTVVVSLTSQGKVVALPDANHDGKADQIKTLLSGLRGPHGLVFRCDGQKCLMYVAEENQLVSYDYDFKNFAAKNKKILLTLPTGGRHTTRSLLLQSNKLLISIGSSCDACKENNNKRAAVVSYDLISHKSGIFASGLRNSVFMTIETSTGKIFATEMGRDYLGDNIPPDEINVLEEGKNYGWPYCYGKNVHDTEFDKSKINPCSSKTPSLIDLPAHSAPLGITFAPASWGSAYENSLLVAYHGSWNRSTPTGYKVVLVRMDKKGKYLETEDFITGFIVGGKKIGRPTGILALENGEVYIGDDQGGKIYLIKHL